MTPISIIRRRLSSKSSSPLSKSSVEPDNTIGAQSAIQRKASSPEKKKLLMGEKNQSPQRTSYLSSPVVASAEELKHIANPEKQQLALVEKVHFCSQRANFDSVDAKDIAYRDTKRKTLLELVDFLNTLSQNSTGSNPSAGSYGRKDGSADQQVGSGPYATGIFTEVTLKAMVFMISENIFIEGSPQLDDYDPEEDDPVLDPGWPHKQVVLEFLLRLIVSPDLNTKLAKKTGIFDQAFLVKLIHRFETDDHRERDYLKSILHRVYGKFFTHRKFIREQISFTFSRYIDTTSKHHGIAELLEILGSIINGFALPLKKEHLQFLRKSLMPLHKSRHYSQYQQQLSYCVTQYIEKQKATAIFVISELLHLWPWSNSQKQVLFVSELEEVLEALHPLNDQIIQILGEVSEDLFSHLARCVSSDHFQVAERALFLWNNQTLSANGCLSFAFADKALPLLYSSLSHNVEEELQTETATVHWNSTVATLSERVLTLYKQGLSESNYSALIDAAEQSTEARQKRAQARESKWKEILKVASELSAPPVETTEDT